MNRLLCASGLLAALSLLTSSPAVAQNPPASIPQRTALLFQHQSVDQAWKAAVTARKPLLVMFTSEHCVYCKKMMKETYSHPAIRQLLVENTETVLAHSKRYRTLAKKLGVRGYPTTMVVSPEGKVLDFLPGYVEPRAFAQRIHPLLKQSPLSGNESSVAVTR